MTIATINNSYPRLSRMNLPTISLLSRVYTMSATYVTNIVTNNTAELLARILACELLPVSTPAITVYNSTVAHNQHLALLGNTFTNIQRKTTVFPVISRMLAQRLDATQMTAPLTTATQHIPPLHSTLLPPTIHDTITM